MRDRTADLLDANQALSQLSYSPLYIDKDIFYATQNVQQQSVLIHTQDIAQRSIAENW